MITVEEALKIIDQNIRDHGVESIPLHSATGRIIREEIGADRDMPPYDRVTMDGIAIVFSEFERGRREFKVDDVAPAGSPVKHLSDSEKCLEVMTGAILPEGTDTVIPYEMVEINEGVATVQLDDIEFRQNIHFQGIDRKKGDVIIAPGKKLSSVEIGVCATVGKSEVSVSRLPKAIIISTGDELVDIDQSPLPHQIRRSNVYRIKTLLSNYHINVDTAHLNDDYEEIVNQLKKILSDYELVILSGGVSKGKFDFLPKALEELGVQKYFHRIKQRPGKPFWFGGKPGAATVFAFPGNPVSSFMCMQQYFKRWLEKSLRADENVYPKAVLNDNVLFKPDLTYFLEVKLSYSQKGKLLANPVKGNGSGDLANLVDADAFIVLPRGREEFKKGEVHPLIFYRELG